MNNDGKNQFFIVGSQRSGTTLMELVLNSHPNIKVIGEPKVYEFLKEAETISDRIVGYKAPCLTYNYDFIYDCYSDSKIIFMFRNIHAVVNSMLSLDVGNGYSWAKAFSHNEAAYTISRVSNLKIRHQFGTELVAARENKDILRQAVLCAYSKMYLYIEYVKIGLKVKIIKYRDLVTYPKATIFGALGFLGLKWDDNVLQHHLLHKGIVTGVDSERKIDKSSLEAWRDQLSKDEINDIDEYLIYLNRLVKSLSEEQYG